MAGLATATTRAPTATAICTAALPTPPAASVMSTVWPGLQPPPVDQALMRGTGADHQRGRLGEARPDGHRGHPVRQRQRQFGEPASGREQDRVHPLVRLDAGPVAGRFDDAGDFLTRDKRQGNPGKATSEETDVPRARARAAHPDQHLARRGCRVGQTDNEHLAPEAAKLRRSPLARPADITGSNSPESRREAAKSARHGRGAGRVPPTCASWSAHSRWRSTNFWVLPVDVFGSGPNSIESGHL